MNKVDYHYIILMFMSAFCFVLRGWFLNDLAWVKTCWMMRLVDHQPILGMHSMDFCKTPNCWYLTTYFGQLWYWYQYKFMFFFLYNCREHPSLSWTGINIIMASGSLAQADIRSLLNCFPYSCIVKASSYLHVKSSRMIILGQCRYVILSKSVNSNNVIVHP